MFTCKRLKDCSFSEITKVWNEAFSNYSVNLNMSVDQIAFMIGRNEFSPEHSIVIFDEHLPIGFVLTSIKKINGTIAAWNGGTGVAPNYQGRGIGNLLMNELMDEYKRIGVQTVALEVLKDNAGAISLYEKYGFQKTGSLTVLELNEKHISLHIENNLYISENGLAADVKSVPFYNENAAWSHRVENIQNGRSTLVKDPNNKILGYCLFTEITRTTGEKVIMCHQCEVDPSITEKETILKLLVFAIHQEADKRKALIKTGDFTSSSEEVVSFLKQVGFRTVAERFNMIVKLV